MEPENHQHVHDNLTFTHILSQMVSTTNCHNMFQNEGESVNVTQMDIKRKTCDIRTRKKHLFLDITSINTDTPVPSLYQCAETRSTEVF
jgi:hypothetical protein